MVIYHWGTYKFLLPNLSKVQNRRFYTSWSGEVGRVSSETRSGPLPADLVGALRCWR